MIDSLFIGNRDGGIVNTFSQVPSSSDPVVIIGLGGTGVDAISRLKTKLQRQIEPDNKYDVIEYGVEPRYGHIKFLGIDADEDWLESSPLTWEESFNINCPGIFVPMKLHALKEQKELQWMSIDYMSQHFPANSQGAGAYRQFGRYLTIARANDIRVRISKVIMQACSGFKGRELNVHIISGISGGMGGGSFIDVCYITRNVLRNIGLDDTKVFGYFVLPDAVISKDGIIRNPVSTALNERNGIASLLEIEHLMNLKDSNEWFEQDYGSFQIRTQQKLVDICHFVSATKVNGVRVPNGYEYALNVIGDYIIGTWYKKETSIVKDHIKFIPPKLDPEPERGYSQNYYIIGSANAEIPTTQMATYLATQLFKKLTICTKMPDNIQIEHEFADYLKLTTNRFKQLENQIEQGALWTEIPEQKVSQMITHRKSMEKKVDSYIYEAGASSIPGLALNKLIEIIENPTKGPIYAYGMMNKTGADIFCYLDDRMKYCSFQKHHARDQNLMFQRLEPEARRTLANSNFFTKKKNIKEYASVLNNIAYWEVRADLYEQLEILMENLKVAFGDINASYLKPLYDTTMDLLATFNANNNYFKMGKGDESQDGFTKQLVQFSRIQPQLDAEVTKLDSRDETTGLLKILTAHPDIWMEHDELKLKAKISNYVLQKFNPILSGSIESFLRKDLNMVGAPVATFANAIERQIINPLFDDATPIFWTSEPLVTDNTKTVHRSILTVPSIANSICLAADQHKNGSTQIEVRKSLINDRVIIHRTVSGVPMFAYDGLIQYLASYNSYSGLGLHLYERNVNWRETLTFPYPYSLDPKYTKNAEELLEIYHDAEGKGIIYFRDTNAYVKQYEDIDPKLLKLDSLMVDGKFNIGEAYQRIDALEQVLNAPVNEIPINSKGNRAGNRVVIDNFLRFYGIQQAVKKEVEKYDCIVKSIEEIKEALNNN